MSCKGFQYGEHVTRVAKAICPHFVYLFGNLGVESRARQEQESATTGKTHIYTSDASTFRDTSQRLSIKREVQGARQLVGRARREVEEGHPRRIKKAVEHLVDGAVTAGHDETIYIRGDHSAAFAGLSCRGGDKEFNPVAALLQQADKFFDPRLGAASPRDGVAYHKELHFSAAPAL
jgi:hypothetical protein